MVQTDPLLSGGNTNNALIRKHLEGGHLQGSFGRLIAPIGGPIRCALPVASGAALTQAQNKGGAQVHDDSETDDSGASDFSKAPVQVEHADTPRVLVVDDDPMVCMAIEIYLRRHHFHVTIAEGGETGLRALEGAEFDLMIVDIFMPHMRGFESIRIFHERAPNVPLIAMSGYAFASLESPAPDFLRIALELGAARCLRKPFTPGALLTAIHECLGLLRNDRRCV